jgi:hypothetical protein
LKKHPKGALLKLPFFTTDMKKKFFTNLWLTFHSWSPFPTLLFYLSCPKSQEYVLY